MRCPDCAATIPSWRGKSSNTIRAATAGMPRPTPPARWPAPSCRFEAGPIALLLDRQAGTHPVDEAVAVVLHVRVAELDQRVGGERAALADAAIDDDGRGLVRRRGFAPEFQQTARDVEKMRC